jgi:uncharacterized surface protein with fasciclin (FAS1) repeats
MLGPAMSIRAAALLAAVLLTGARSAAEEIRFHGNSVMYSNNNIISNLIASRDHTKLMDALRSVGLEQSLLHQGLFTLFAPDNEAFSKLPADYAESIFRRVNREDMARLLACHIVAEGNLAGRKLFEKLRLEGPQTLRTLGGCRLELEIKDGAIFVRDESGHQAKILEADILQSNGMIQLTDQVFVPRT